MKHINFNFSSSDVKTIIFSLSLIPLSKDLAKNEAQASINNTLALSASDKLINHRTDLIPNEFRVIYVSLQYVQLINQGVIHADDEVKKECCNYLFSVNKLVSAFEKQFG